MSSTSPLESLANIHMSAIMIFALIVSFIRIYFLKSKTPTARALVEVADAALFASVVMFMIVLPFAVKSFYIPSGSMRETLIDDDHILVDKFIYRIALPHRGDIVVFAAPPIALSLVGEHAAPGDPPIDYIKRLQGIPGDVILVHHGYVQVGGRQYTNRDIRDRLGMDESAAQFDQEHIKLLPNGAQLTSGPFNTDSAGNPVFQGKTVIVSADDLGAMLTGVHGQQIGIYPGYMERNGARVQDNTSAEDPDYDLKIVNGQAYVKDYVNGIDTVKLDGAPVDDADQARYDRHPSDPIPPNHYLMLGDNRNDSNDGSRWGCLDGSRLIGKAALIFYPFNRIRLLR